MADSTPVNDRDRGRGGGGAEDAEADAIELLSDAGGAGGTPSSSSRANTAAAASYDAGENGERLSDCEQLWCRRCARFRSRPRATCVGLGLTLIVTALILNARWASTLARARLEVEIQSPGADPFYNCHSLHTSMDEQIRAFAPWSLERIAMADNVRTFGLRDEPATYFRIVGDSIYYRQTKGSLGLEHIINNARMFPGQLARSLQVWYSQLSDAQFARLQQLQAQPTYRGGALLPNVHVIRFQGDRMATNPSALPVLCYASGYRELAPCLSHPLLGRSWEAEYRQLTKVYGEIVTAASTGAEAPPAVKEAVAVGNVSAERAQWNTRRNVCYFHGSDDNPNRVALRDWAAKKNVSWLDVDVYTWDAAGHSPQHPFVYLWDQMRIKCLIVIDGLGWPDRLFPYLLTGGVLLRQDSWQVEWWEALMQEYTHYIPMLTNVGSDLPRLDGTIQYILADRAQTQMYQIGQNARRLVMNHLRPSQFMCTAVRQLYRIADPEFAGPDWDDPRRAEVPDTTKEGGWTRVVTLRPTLDAWTGVRGVEADWAEPRNDWYEEKYMQSAFDPRTVP